MSGWLGEPLDVGYAIDVMHPLAARPAVCAFEDDVPLELDP